MALLEADVALPVAKALVDRVRDRALGEEVARSLNPGQAFVKIVHDELVAVLGGDSSPVDPHGHPAVIMLVGLQGAGKTTTAAKLARQLTTTRGGAVLLASTDVYRPAARDQLATLAAELGVGFTRARATACSHRARSAGGRAARWPTVVNPRHGGRLHVDANAERGARASRHRGTGRDLVRVESWPAKMRNSARAFMRLAAHRRHLTKTDATRAAALHCRSRGHGLPIKLVGTGEKVDALEPFVPARFASRISAWRCRRPSSRFRRPSTARNGEAGGKVKQGAA